ncbi:hypothetical protein CDAR_401031 [Caerostris darwini]|uniref:Uncharacterized protein n=1 Tax=Caerostris darwini TaxID=1538125 RepID=A0AAV4TJE5_9ARAC|nr:hypothetical protein CDAR_401031 [Caerostris darwini]
MYRNSISENQTEKISLTNEVIPSPDLDAEFSNIFSTASLTNYPSEDEDFLQIFFENPKTVPDVLDDKKSKPRKRSCSSKKLISKEKKNKNINFTSDIKPIPVTEILPNPCMQAPKQTKEDIFTRILGYSPYTRNDSPFQCFMFECTKDPIKGEPKE